MRLTKSTVERVPPPAAGQAFYRDDLLPGFALRVTAGGVRSFVVEKRVGGKVRRQTLGRFGVLTVEQARRAAQRFLGQVATGRDPIAERREATARGVTLGEVFKAYLATRRGLKPATVHDYQRLMREAFADWTTRPMAELTRDAVATRHARLGERSEARANNAMRVLRALFNFAAAQYEDGSGRTLFPENPVSRLTHTRAWYRVERRRTLIRRAELPAFCEAVMHLKAQSADPLGRTVADLLLVLLLTGLRRSEAMGLRWQQVDLQDATLTLPDPKNREPLVLPLSDYLAALLAERQAAAAGPWVFPGIHPDAALVEPRKQLAKVTARSGVTFTLHDLRRTFITVAESLDIPPYAIKRLVNHKIAGDVTAGYIVMDVERLRAPMQRITDYLLKAGGLREAAPVVALSALRQ